VNPDYKNLLNSALKLLSFRPRSRAEVERYLQKKTSDTTLINQILDKLVELKFINDTDFAKWVIESRSRSRPRGSRLLKQELKSKGIEATSDLLPDSDEELLNAQKALQKKAIAWQNLSNLEYRKKIYGYLTYRGFSSTTIEKLIKNRYNDPDVN
jgi:regulatory protein